MLNGTILCVVMLSIVMQNGVILSVVMLSVVMQNGVILSVVILSVMAPVAELNPTLSAYFAPRMG